jgi:hypothetical protein
MQYNRADALARCQTQADYIRMLDSINTWSADGNHRAADEIIVGYLRAHGAADIADAWVKATSR